MHAHDLPPLFSLHVNRSLMPAGQSQLQIVSRATEPCSDVGVTDDILKVVRHTTGVDFSGYRSQTVERRIRNRMMTLGITDMGHYHRLLRDSSEEVPLLVERLTIKVSRFYRNPLVFDAIRAEILPKLAALDRPVRIWSGGCGHGEEAYTLAMLMEEANVPGEVIATDIDPLALHWARMATYDKVAIADLPASLAAQFLTPVSKESPARYEVDQRVRARVAFEHADLTSPGLTTAEPFDLISCRNMLIYWNPAVQRAIFGHLLSRLRCGGWLCLGEAEWPDRTTLSRLEVSAARLRLFRHRGTESFQ